MTTIYKYKINQSKFPEFNGLSGIDSIVINYNPESQTGKADALNFFKSSLKNVAVASRDKTKLDSLIDAVTEDEFVKMARDQRLIEV